jgi:hypothetical protein
LREYRQAPENPERCAESPHGRACVFNRALYLPLALDLFLRRAFPDDVNRSLFPGLDLLDSRRRLR